MTKYQCPECSYIYDPIIGDDFEGYPSGTKFQDLPEDFAYLLTSKKVILSPHVGGWTHESYFKLSNVLALMLIC